METPLNMLGIIDIMNTLLWGTALTAKISFITFSFEGILQKASTVLLLPFLILLCTSSSGKENAITHSRIVERIESSQKQTRSCPAISFTSNVYHT